MLARALTALALFLAVLLVPLSPSLAAKTRRSAEPWRPVAAEILMDAQTGKVLRSRNADRLTYPASLTKMMTLFLTFEALDRGKLSFNRALPVSRHASSMPPSRLWLSPGGSITVEDAILALVTKSANDVAVVLAEALAGSETAFADRMTARARALGMKHTVFRNASGLPHRGQRTTARDMAILSRALIQRHAKYYAFFSRRSFDWQGQTVYGHNRLLSRYEGMDGIKTGFINASGFNLAASAVRGGHRFIVVVLGGESAVKRDDRVAELMDLGFHAHTPLPPDTVVAGNEEAVSQGDAALGTRSAVPASKAIQQKAVQQKAANHKAANHKTANHKTANHKTAKKAGRTTAAGHWSIQVGAYASKAAARRGAEAAAKTLGGKAAQAKPLTVHSGGLYKARLTGFHAASARAACAALKARKTDCLTIAGR